MLNRMLEYLFNQRALLRHLTSLIVTLMLVAGGSHGLEISSAHASIQGSLCTVECRQSAAALDVQVYLYEGGSGAPVDETATAFYQEGLIFDKITLAEIGTVPDTTDGHIFDSNNNPIGFIAPSTAANEELPVNWDR